jgi:hypothetical protein
MEYMEEPDKLVRELTPKQEKFCQAIFNGMTLVDAYKSAYNAENMQKTTIYKRAAEQMNHGGISGRVAELRGELQERTLWTKEEAANVLKSIIYRVIEDDKGNIVSAVQDKDAVAAIKELNAMHGINAPSKQEITGKDGAPLGLADFYGRK